MSEEQIKKLKEEEFPFATILKRSDVSDKEWFSILGSKDFIICIGDIMLR